MDRDEVEVHKNAKKERGQYPAILTEQAWSIKDLLYGFTIKLNYSNKTKHDMKLLFFFFFFFFNNHLFAKTHYLHYLHYGLKTSLDNTVFYQQYSAYWLLTLVY